MTLTLGTRLGTYEIVAPLGTGGMGEVFRARDATLNRDIAIKVLPAAMAGDVERLSRFRREAQVLAALNHPNIAHVYGFEGATLPDGSTAHFLAMELVEGEDLSARARPDHQGRSRKERTFPPLAAGPAGWADPDLHGWGRGEPGRVRRVERRGGAPRHRRTAHHSEGSAYGPILRSGLSGLPAGTDAARDQVRPVEPASTG